MTRLRRSRRIETTCSLSRRAPTAAHPTQRLTTGYPVRDTDCVRDVNFYTSPLTTFVTRNRTRTTMDPFMPDDEFELERSFGEQLDNTIEHHAEPLPPPFR